MFTTKFKNPYTDLKSFIKFYTNSPWQIFWDFCDRNKLYCIQNKVNKPYNLTLKRQNEVIISRIRIGHSNSNINSFVPLTGGATAGMHILRLPSNYTTHFSGDSCSDTFPARNLLFFNVQTMHDLFTMFDVHVLLQFFAGM